MEAEMVKELGEEDKIDRTYYEALVNDAIDKIAQYGDYKWFTSDKEYDLEDNEIYPF